MNTGNQFFAGLFLAVVFALSACASYAPEELRKEGWSQLSKGQLESMGAFTAYGTSRQSGNNFAVYNDGSGILKLSANNGAFTDRGTIEYMSDDSVCVQYEKVRRGLKRCVTYWKKGENYRVITESQSLSAEFTVKPGNPDNM